MSKLFDNANNDGFVNQSDPENVQIDALKTTEDQIREALEKSYTKDKLNKQKKFNAVCLRKLANTLPEHEGLVRMKARIPVLHNLIPTPKDVDDYSTMDLYPTFVALKSSFNPQPADSTDAVPPGTAIVVQFDNVSNFANPEILEISVIKSEEDLASGAAVSGSSTTSRRSPDGKRAKFKSDLVAHLNRAGTAWTTAKGGKYPFRGGFGIAYNAAFIEITSPGGHPLYERRSPGGKRFSKGINYQLVCQNADGTGTNSRIFTTKTIDLHTDQTKPWAQEKTSDFARTAVVSPAGAPPVPFAAYPKYMIDASDQNFKWNTKSSPGVSGTPAIILAKDSPSSFYARSDMKADLEAAINEIRGNGGIFACSSARKPSYKIPLQSQIDKEAKDPKHPYWSKFDPKFVATYESAMKSAAGGSSTFKPWSHTLPAGFTDATKKLFYNKTSFSLHYTGHALDFHHYSGCSFPMTDPYIITYDGITSSGGIQWRVFYRASGAPVRNLKALVMARRMNHPGGTDGRHVIPQFQNVSVPCYDLTDTLQKYGFERILAHSSQKYSYQRWRTGTSSGGSKIVFGKSRFAKKWKTDTGNNPAMTLADGATPDFEALVNWNTSKAAGDTINFKSGGTYFFIQNFRLWSEWWHFDYVKGIKAGGSSYNFYQALEGFYSAKSLAKFSPDFIKYANLAVASKSGHSFRIP